MKVFPHGFSLKSLVRCMSNVKILYIVKVSLRYSVWKDGCEPKLNQFNIPVYGKIAPKLNQDISCMNLFKTC